MVSSSTEDGPGKFVASAEPDKRLFIEMLTRDIELVPAILDLWDNSIDAAMRALDRGSTTGGDKPLKGYKVELLVDSEELRIIDNCGGIPLEIARDYAFRFGRAEGAPSVEGAVGSFGVGLKRALFKIGRAFSVESRSSQGAFKMEVNVGAWASVSGGDWNFPFESVDPGYSGAGPDGTGTTVRIYELIPSIAAQFSDSLFIQRLRHELEIRRPEAYDLGIETIFNKEALKPHIAALAKSKNLVPAIERLTLDSGVEIFIRAGIVKGKNDELDDGDATKFIGEDPAGWYVIANGRVLLAAERTRITGWGDGVARYHPQYRNFRGYVDLRAADGRLLPWNTTKTSVDEDSDVWKVVYGHMKKVLADVQVLINRLKSERTVQRETGYRGPILTELDEAVATPLDELPKKKSPLQYPREGDGKRAIPRQQRITFQVDQERYFQALEAAEAGSAAEFGRFLFDYFWDAEIGD